MNVGAESQLTVDSISNIGPHYARTLREWRNSFLEKFESVIEPALKEEYPDVMNGKNGSYEIEVFKRKWICEWRTRAPIAAGTRLTLSCRLLVRTGSMRVPGH